MLRVGQQSYPSYEIASWSIPENVRHNVNFIAFATGPETVGGGLWEFDESPSQYPSSLVATCVIFCLVLLILLTRNILTPIKCT